jgi:tRNA threonylcarbamoyladenosine biosynthesis protein TsaB
MLVAIDTATNYASLALHDGFQVLREETWRTARRHTVELMPRLVGALEQLNLSVDHLSGVCVTRGPGSFTGLRVGMSVAKGLAITRNLPIVGIPTLDVVVAGLGRDQRQACAVLQAGRRRICAANFEWQSEGWQAIEDPYLTTWAILGKSITEPVLVCGEIDRAGAETLAPLGDTVEFVPPAARLRRASFLAELAWRRLNRGDTDDLATLAPTYLQHPV